MAYRFRTARDGRTTSQRGYGAEHVKERQRRLELYTPDDPCTRCGRRLGENRSRWHLPHTADRTGYHPGFWCAPCNLTDGASRGGQRAKAKRQARAQHTDRVSPLRW